MSRSEYVLANDSPQTRNRFSGLEALCDPITFRHLDDVGITTGWSCLEVGAGAGSVARWMAGRVGRTGHVVAVDLDTRWLDASSPGLEVRRLDLRTDPLPEGVFDLVHARLVLQHLPEREDVLRRLVSAVKPGGFVVTSEFDNHYDGCPAPADERDVLVNRVQEAFIALIGSAGGDVTYGRRLHRVFAAAGLEDVRSDGYVTVAAGGSPGSEVMLANVRQMRSRLVGAFGLDDDEMDRYEAALEDPTFSWLMPVLFTASGRRPAKT